MRKFLMICVISSLALFTNAKANAQEQNPDEWHRRGIAGHITALNPTTKEITLLARSREGTQPIIIDGSGKVSFRRFAPDSFSLSDARTSSFAELKVGDFLRALGEKSADGARFTPEEIVSGSFLRVGGKVTATNTVANEVTIRNDRTGKPLTVAIGQRTTLRRISPAVAASFEQSRAQKSGARAKASSNSQSTQEAGAGGRSFQELINSLPVIPLADLKPGDTILAITSRSDNPSRVTAVTLLTGDTEFIRRLQRLQGRPLPQVQSPGLPGDVTGGGVGGEREQP